MLYNLMALKVCVRLQEYLTQGRLKMNKRKKINNSFPARRSSGICSFLYGSVSPGTYLLIEMHL